MSIGNAIGNFLIGNTDPNSDGLAVSTGIGDGQAQVLPKYSGEAWQQATQNRQRQQQIDLEAQRQRQAAEAPKGDIMNALDKISGYRPQEFKNIQMRKDALEKEVLELNSSSPDYPQKLAKIRSKLSALGEGVAVSRDIKNSYTKATEVLNSGKYWIPKNVKDKIESDYNEDYGIIDDDYAWMDKLAPKAAAVELSQNAEPLIKDFPAYITQIVKSSTMGEPEIVAEKGVNGQVVNKIVSYTDPEKLEANLTAAWGNSPQIQEQFPVLDDFIQEGRNRSVFKGRIDAKFAPNQSSKSWGGGSGVKKVGNFTLNPVQEYNYTDVNKDKVDYQNYVDAMNKTADSKTEKAQKEQIYNSIVPFEDWAKKGLNTKKVDAVPFSIEGVAENSKHQFILRKEGGKDVIVDGVSTLYSPDRKAFIVKTDKGEEFAPIGLNTNYLTDNKATLDEFYKAIGETKGGNVVSLNKEGKIVGKEKMSSSKQLGADKSSPILITKGMKFEKGKWYKGKNGEIQQYK